MILLSSRVVDCKVNGTNPRILKPGGQKWSRSRLGPKSILLFNTINIVRECAMIRECTSPGNIYRFLFHSSQNAFSITPTSAFSLGSRMRWPTMAGKRHESEDRRNMAVSPPRGRKAEVTRTRLLLMIAALLVGVNLVVLWATSNNNLSGTAYLTVREGQAGTQPRHAETPLNLSSTVQ